MADRVASFYDGKSVLVTGAAGYLGVILLEILLRCCPGIKRIYILLREKKGVSPQRRKESVLKKEIFQVIKDKYPEALRKVHVVAGDVALQNLGMSNEDALRVAQDVSIVFHCAAAISFLKPLRFILFQNAVSTDNVIEFCRKLKKLDVLVYTSTAYSNCNRNCTLEERVYRLPFPAQDFLDVVRNGSDSELDHLMSLCTPTWPNSYTFSKCLSENIFADKASDLPVAIIRPSIITSVWKGILPGFVEEGSGMVGLSLGIGKGFIRVIQMDAKKKIDHVPVDVVANTHVVAAWAVGTERYASPYIVNCTSSEIAPCSWGHYTKALLSLSLKHPLPKAYQRPSLKIVKSTVGYWFLSIVEHYAPAMAIDSLLWLSGRKPKLFALYRFFDKSMDAMRYFVTREWNFRCENLKNLMKAVDSEDAEIFHMDMKGYSVEEFSKMLPSGAPFYKWDIDPKPFKKRMRTTFARNLMTTFIKWFTMTCLCLSFYVTVYLVYRGVQFHVSH